MTLDILLITSYNEPFDSNRKQILARKASARDQVNKLQELQRSAHFAAHLLKLMHQPPAEGANGILKSYLEAMSNISENQSTVVRDLNLGDVIVNEVTENPLDMVHQDNARAGVILDGTIETPSPAPLIGFQVREPSPSLFRSFGAHFTSDIEERHQQDLRRAEEYLQLDLISLSYPPSSAHSITLETEIARNRKTLSESSRIGYSHRYIDDAESMIYALLAQVRRSSPVKYCYQGD